MPTSKTAPSTPRLSEYAKRFVYPDGIQRTVWTRVEAKGLTLGLGFDWWQSQLGTVCLGYGEDGKYVATVGGIGMSIPRQVGKTYFVLATLVILCILFPGLQVVWTAHHLRTSTKTFTTLRGICRRKKVAPHVQAMRSANGEQQVQFVNGSLIMFGARSMGFGRGFDEIDVEVFDEAQILDAKALEDIIAATNQARHPHGALLFYMGTPPRPSDPSEAFANRRKDAWSDESPADSIWLEIGADASSHIDDRAQWPLMNPSFPLRTPEESLLRLKKNLSDDDSWDREGRGIWDDDSAKSPIHPTAWADLADLSKGPAPHIGRVVIAVDTDPSRQRTTITACGMRADGFPLVEVIDNLPGVDWAEQRIKKLVADNPDVVAVVIDKRSAAATLIHPLTEARLPVVGTDAAQMAQACGLFIDTVNETAGLRHLNQAELNTAVRSAVTRPLGDAIAWNRKKPTADITPLTSATLALWGHLTGVGIAKNAGRGRVIALT